MYVKATWLEAEGYISDRTNKLDDTETKTVTARRKRFLNNNLVQLKGRLHTDIGLQDKLLPSHLDIKITLTRSKPEFVFHSEVEDTAFKVTITDATLQVRKVKLTPTRQLAFEKNIAKTPIRIPINYVSLKSISLSSGISSYSQNGIFTGPLPHLVIIGLIENAAFVGTYNKNPFEFKHYDVNSLCLHVNGRSVPSRAYQPDFAKNNYVDSYLSLWGGLSMQFANHEHGITYESYKHGNCLWAFDLTPDNCASANPPVSGSLDINLRFGTALPETVSLLIYGQYKNNIFIDQFRNIVTDISL